MVVGVASCQHHSLEAKRVVLSGTGRLVIHSSNAIPKIILISRRQILPRNAAPRELWPTPALFLVPCVRRRHGQERERAIKIPKLSRERAAGAGRGLEVGRQTDRQARFAPQFF